jgi:hypothetical protein
LSCIQSKIIIHYLEKNKEIQVFMLTDKDFLIDKAKKMEKNLGRINKKQGIQGKFQIHKKKEEELLKTTFKITFSHSIYFSTFYYPFLSFLQFFNVFQNDLFMYAYNIL